MIYYLSRVLFWLLLYFMPSFVLSKKKLIVREAPKNTSNYKKPKFTKKSKYILFITYAFVVVITLISAYPFEGAFLRFQSPEASLNYSIFHNNFWNNYMIENEKCYFVYSYKDGNVKYHSISKYSDGIGVVDYNSHTRRYQTKSGMNGDDFYNIVTYAVYDKHSDCTCYFVCSYGPTGTEYDNIIKINRKGTECLYYKEKGKAVYALIEDGAPKDSIIVNIHGLDITV